jgi:hypothetical protein
MSEEAKQFIFGLEQCRDAGGMKWFGKIPKEVQLLFDIKITEIAHGYTVAGVYVTLRPQYEAYTPDWRGGGKDA